MGSFLPGFGISRIRPRLHDGGQVPLRNHKLLKDVSMLSKILGQCDLWCDNGCKASLTIVLVIPSAPGDFSLPQ